jgi:hypothetical protein
MVELNRDLSLDEIGVVVCQSPIVRPQAYVATNDAILTEIPILFDSREDAVSERGRLSSREPDLLYAVGRSVESLGTNDGSTWQVRCRDLRFVVWEGPFKKDIKGGLFKQIMEGLENV